MAWKMPTIGAGKYGFLGLETKTGTASRIADQQLKRAQKDPTKLAPSEAAKQAMIAQKMAATRSDIQQQTEALAESALGGTSVQAGALRDAGTDLGETLVEGQAGASAEVEAAGQQQQFAELERLKDNAAEAEEAKKATNAALLKGAGQVLGVAGALMTKGPIGATVGEIAGSLGGIKPGTTDEEEEEEELVKKQEEGGP
tara:strand:+ start:1928 stop:2527 length:600 start_codon:yes stop_codon:yes gene_type:complete